MGLIDKFKDLGEDASASYPSFAWISLARRGMEKISLDQCFLKDCDNEDIKMLEQLKIEESETDEMHTKIFTLKCKKCGGIFKLKLDTIKKVAKPTKPRENAEEEALSMGVIYALDEDDNNLGHVGYF